MNVLVILRLVPDALEELPLIDGALDRDEIDERLNEFDDYALEEAVQIKEESDATVIALSLESHGKRMLQTAIARGADRAVSLAGDFAPGATARQMAPVYAAAAEQLAADLVLTGVQTPEDGFGQLVPFMAALLDRPQANGVTSASLVDGGLHTVQEYGGGRSATLFMPLPAILGVQMSREPPRYVSGSRLRQVVQSAQIETMESAVPMGRELSTVTALQAPASGGHAEMLGDDADVAADRIAAILRDRGLHRASHG